MQKGGNGIPGIDIVRDFKLHYIDIPVLLRIRAPVTEKFTPYLLGGPYGRLLLRVKVDMHDYGTHTERDQYNNLGYGVKFGAGVEFGRLVVDGRYDLGISEIDKENGLDGYARGFSVSIGILF